MKLLRAVHQRAALLTHNLGFGQSKNSVTANKRHFRAAVLHEFGQPLIVEEEQFLTPHSHEVLVAVDSAAVNHADVRMVHGQHHLRPKLPLVPGFELAGTVKSVGHEVSAVKEGDRVLALKTYGTGAYAQQCLVSQNELYPIPYTLDFEIAASLSVAYGTAFLTLTKIAQEKIGNYVLILTSQGASGLAAIDLAQNVFKMQVIVATDTEEKCAIVRSMGVLMTVEYEEEELLSRVHSATFGQGVDAVIDTVGGKYFHAALKCLKPGGHILSLGFSSNQIPNVALIELHRLRATLTGVWLGGLANSDPKRFSAIIENIIGLYDERYITPFIANKYPLDEVETALQHSSNNIGKAILILRQDSSTQKQQSSTI